MITTLVQGLNTNTYLWVNKALTPISSHFRTSVWTSAFSIWRFTKFTRFEMVHHLIIFIIHFNPSMCSMTVVLWPRPVTSACLPRHPCSQQSHRATEAVETLHPVATGLCWSGMYDYKSLIKNIDNVIMINRWLRFYFAGVCMCYNTVGSHLSKHTGTNWNIWFVYIPLMHSIINLWISFGSSDSEDSDNWSLDTWLSTLEIMA